MKQIRELHRHLFGEEMYFDDQHCHKPIDDGYFLMRRKNQCSDEIGNDKQLSKNEIYKNNFFKKNAAKKQTINRLTFEKSKRIFGVFYIFTLTNIKRTFFSLNRVPKSRGKGTKIQGMRLNEAEIWAKGTKKSGKGVVFRDIKNIRGTTFRGDLIGVDNDG